MFYSLGSVEEAVAGKCESSDAGGFVGLFCRRIPGFVFNIGGAISTQALTTLPIVGNTIKYKNKMIKYYK